MQRLFASIRPLQAMMRSSQSAFVSPVMVSARRSLRSSISPRRPPARRPRAPAILCATHDPVPMPEEPSLPSWRQLSDTSGMPLILEDDLEEQFVRGSGPGGQKINKTASCVVSYLPFCQPVLILTLCRFLNICPRVLLCDVSRRGVK